MSVGLAARLGAEQGPGGGFRCTIEHPGGAVETHENGFATALVLRALGVVPGSPALEAMRARALDYLERCADPALPGAFGFWPAGERPAWGRRVGPDADDTAVISLELCRAGRLPADRLREIARDVLAAAVVTEHRAPHPHWLRPLVFPTWLGSAAPGAANPIDCAVNANVVALMAACGATDLPGYADAIGMIDDAVASVSAAPPGQRRLRLRTLTPYYPDPGLFLAMIDHAIACGATELRPAGDELGALLGEVEVPAAARGALCSNAYGGPVWRCRALALVEPRRRRRGLRRLGGSTGMAAARKAIGMRAKSDETPHIVRLS